MSSIVRVPFWPDCSYLFLCDYDLIYFRTMLSCSTSIPYLVKSMSCALYRTICCVNFWFCRDRERRVISLY